MLDDRTAIGFSLSCPVISTEPTQTVLFFQGRTLKVVGAAPPWDTAAAILNVNIQKQK